MTSVVGVLIKSKKRERAKVKVGYRAYLKIFDFYLVDLVLSVIMI